MTGIVSAPLAGAITEAVSAAAACAVLLLIYLAWRRP